MDLEEIQATWQEMSTQLAHQKKLTNKIILEMTQEKFKSKFNRIFYSELFGAAICFITAILILLNFSKLDTWYLVVMGILSLVFLIIMPIISLKLVKNTKNIQILDRNYKEIFLEYTKNKKHFNKLQKISALAVIPLFLISIPVFSKIFNNKDFFTMVKPDWLYGFIFIIGIGVIIFTRWVLKSYAKTITDVDKILSDLDT